MKTLLQHLRPIVPKRIEAHAALAMGANAALAKSGWFRSRIEGASVDANGHPLPWYTYSSIAFLDRRIPSGASVFEFGMGNSTLWWAQRATKVVAVEHDQPWYDRTVSQMPKNVTPIFADEAGDYPQAAVNLGEPIDVLVIDGRRRVESCLASLPLLTDVGVVIWDNAEREKYADGYAALEAHGFRRLDFWGIGPITANESLTTIFYRSGNLLGI